MRYCRRTEVVEAIQFNPLYQPPIEGVYPFSPDIPYAIETSGGTYEIKEDDWIVTYGGGRTELFSPDKFKELFEPCPV